MTEPELLQRLRQQPEQVGFDEVLAVIAANYVYTPSRFSNGRGDDSVVNPAGSNEGSCRVFAFAALHGLDAQQTLHCFGDYYRVDVLSKPDADNHANIRSFMRHGWPGVHFDTDALRRK